MGTDWSPVGQIYFYTLQSTNPQDDMADGKQDATVQGNYSHVNGISAASVLASIPPAIFNRNQGEIARTHSVITQMQEQQAFTNGQVLTDVKDAFEGLQSNDKIEMRYIDKYRDIAKKTATSPITPTTAARSPCSIFWTPSAAIAPRNWATARRWLPTCLRSSNSAKPWASEICSDLPGFLRQRLWFRRGCGWNLGSSGGEPTS